MAFSSSGDLSLRHHQVHGLSLDDSEVWLLFRICIMSFSLSADVGTWTRTGQLWKHIFADYIQLLAPEPFLFMFGVLTCMQVCTTCIPGACRGQQVASDLQELELDMVLSCHVGAGNRKQVY